MRIHTPNPRAASAVGLRGGDHVGAAYAGLLACGSVDEFRALAPLPDNAQRMFDDAVVSVGLDRLTVVRRLIERRLVKPLTNWLAVPELYWEKQSKTGQARRTMTPASRGERQLPDRSGVTYPIYATMEDWSLHQRVLLASERAGAPLDTDIVEQSTRRVNEAIEDAAINGGMTVGGNSSPGFFNAPNVNSIVYGGSGLAWDDASKTGANILTDVLSMVTENKSDGYYGPYELFVPTNYENKLMEDYVSGYPKTILARLEELEFNGENLVVNVADQFDDDRTLLFQATSNVVDVIDGQQPTLVSWTEGNPWEIYFAVLACQIPRVKDDYDGGSGICTGYTS